MGGGGIDQQQFDIASLNLQGDTEDFEEVVPKVTLAREIVLQQARAALEGDNQGKRSISLVVIGRCAIFYVKHAMWCY